MRISFSNPSFSAMSESNNSKPSFGKYPYFPEPKIVEKTGYYYIELPSGQLSPLGKNLPEKKSFDVEMNEILKQSKTPVALRKSYDKIYAAAVKGHKQERLQADETLIVNVVNKIKDSKLFNDVKKMFEIRAKNNENHTYANGSMAGALCSENSRLGAIVNVFKKQAK